MRALLGALAGLGLGVAIGWSSACTQPRSESCKQICAREAECSEGSKGEAAEPAFDESDCVAACAALERDKQTSGRVEAHADCIAKAKRDCVAILACK